MKKTILTFLMAFTLTLTALGEPQTLPIETHQTGESDLMTGRERNPINLPLAVFYHPDTNVLEVWCDNDNIQAEVFVYDAAGDIEAYSPYMNVVIQLSTSESHSILLKADGWEAEAKF